MKRKKILTRAVAAAMPLMMAFPVMAAGFNGVETTDLTKVSIPKGIVVQNNGYTQCYTPNITYSYTAAPVTVADGTTVTDANGVSAGVNSGVTGGVSSEATLAFTSGLVSETDASEIAVPKLAQEVVGNIEFDIDISKFSAAGIYRYEITDVTPTSVLYYAGIQRPEDFDPTRTLDVYIVSDGHGGLEVEGYVLTDIEEGSVTPDTDKDPGYVTPDTPNATPVPGEFVPGFEILDGDATRTMGGNGMDVYESYNFDITKLITGSMADPNHQFPFTFTLDALPDGVTVSNKVFSGSTVADSALATGTEFTAALSNNQSYHIYGANPFFAATIAERNDTRSPYKVTIPTTNYDNTVVNPGDSATVDMHVSNYATVNSTSNVSGAVSDQGDINVTNNLTSLDPTGLRSGMLPYIILAGLAAAGIGAAAIVSVKSKKKSSENS